MPLENAGVLGRGLAVNVEHARVGVDLRITFHARDQRASRWPLATALPSTSAGSSTTRSVNWTGGSQHAHRHHLVRLHLVLAGCDETADDVVRGLAAALLEDVFAGLTAPSTAGRGTIVSWDSTPPGSAR